MQELDVEVAEKVMGWVWIDVPKGYIVADGSVRNAEGKILVPPRLKDVQPIERGFHILHALVYPYSTEIEHSWTVVEKIGKRFALIAQESETIPAKAWFQKEGDESYPVSFGKSVSEAICLAALKVVNENK